MKHDRTDRTRPCARFRELADHADGRLDTHAASRLEAHLEECDRCARELAAIKGVLGIMRADRSIDPPAPVMARAIDLFQPEPLRERVRTWLAGRLEELAQLVFDSHSQLAFATARGSLSARRLRFEAARLELDIQVEGRPGGARITGQLLTTDGDAHPVAGARILVASGGRTQMEGVTDDLGEFMTDVDSIDSLRILVIDGGRTVSFVLPPTLGDPDETDRG